MVFGISFRLVIFENPGIDHKITGVAWVSLTLKSFLESFYAWLKVHSWSKPHTFRSTLHMWSVDHLNIDGPLFPVKCVRKFRSALGGEVTHRSACVCARSLQKRNKRKNVWKVGNFYFTILVDTIPLRKEYTRVWSQAKAYWAGSDQLGLVRRCKISAGILVCKPRARLDPSVCSKSADENPKRMSIPPFPVYYYFITAVLRIRRRANTRKKSPRPINQPPNH